MYTWSPEQQMLRDALRRFVDTEVAPHRHALEHGDLPPYDILRKMYAAFGLDAMAEERFERAVARKERRTVERRESDDAPGPSAVALGLMPTIELARSSPGMVTALGVTVGLAAGAVMGKGTVAQMHRWGRDLLTLDKVGAWAITEPGSGSDAFGSMTATARRDGDEYVLNGTKTFITNGPYADTIVFVCKLDEGNDPRDRKVLSFVLDWGMEGLDRSKPLEKMGMHSSPTGEIYVTDVRVGVDRLLGESEGSDRDSGRSSARTTFTLERASVAAMALGIIERCLELSVQYARERVQFGRPIGDFQLIQLKLAKMEVARLNVTNLVLRYIEGAELGIRPTLAEASAMKLYAAQSAFEVASEAVQLYGGNGYMSEFPVEQLCRDAKVLQIYGGTDEIQVSQIARELLTQRGS